MIKARRLSPEQCREILFPEELSQTILNLAQGVDE